MADTSSTDLDLTTEPANRIMRNIVELYDEALDDINSPPGTKGGEIPFESRIVTAADTFDALTNARPYK